MWPFCAVVLQAFKRRVGVQEKMVTCFTAGTAFCGAHGEEYLVELTTKAAMSPSFHSLLV